MGLWLGSWQPRLHKPIPTLPAALEACQGNEKCSKGGWIKATSEHRNTYLGCALETTGDESKEEGVIFHPVF